MYKIGLIILSMLLHGSILAQNTEGIEYQWGIQPKFEAVGNFSEGLCAVVEYKHNVSFWSFVDKSGKTIPTLEALRPSSVSEFKEGLCKLNYARDRIDFINKHGSVVLTVKTEEYANGSDFSEGLAYVSGAGRKKGFFIDKNGYKVINHVRAGEFNEGLAPVFDKHGKVNYIDKKGNIIINLNLEAITMPSDFRSFKEGLAVVQLNKKYGFIDKTGNIVIIPQFCFVRQFSEGLAAVCLNDKWGFIDKTGNIVVAPQFGTVRSFSEGLAAVYLNGKWGFIDKSGNIIVDFQFSAVENFSEGLAAVCLNSKWGFIDKSGNIVVTPQFKELKTYVEGVAFAKKDDKWGLIKVIKGYKPTKPPVNPQLNTVIQAKPKTISVNWNNIASTFANEYAKKTCPKTYHNVYFEGYSQENGNKTKLGLTIKWRGVVCLVPLPYDFLLKGYLLCDNDGTNCRFYEEDRNENLTEAQNCDPSIVVTSIVVAAGTIAIVSSLSSPNKNTPSISTQTEKKEETKEPDPPQKESWFSEMWNYQPTPEDKARWAARDKTENDKKQKEAEIKQAQTPKELTQEEVERELSFRAWEVIKQGVEKQRCEDKVCFFLFEAAKANECEFKFKDGTHGFLWEDKGKNQWWGSTEFHYQGPFSYDQALDWLWKYKHRK